MDNTELEAELDRIASKLHDGTKMSPTEQALVTRQAMLSQEWHVLRRVFACLQWNGDASYASLIEPHLASSNIHIAEDAIWVLCWLGQAERLKPYIMQAVETGLPHDPRRNIGNFAIAGVGRHLRTRHDLDLAQLLIRWAPSENPDDPFYRSTPNGLLPETAQSLSDAAGKAMGDAMGADPEDLLYDDALVAACVKRFIAERQDG